MKHANIALFVPHNGCPNQCSFCNQKSITGVQYQPTAADVDSAVNKAIASSENSGTSFDYEIAFFGGSFTAVDREYMVSLLEAAFRFVCSGIVSGIRISTRPDAIDDEVLAILKAYGVTSIELGAQSMCDEVLVANRRGHTADDVRNASRLIKAYGFELGLQMMTGLYASSNERDIYTANQIISLAPKTVRIYPTVTMAGTPLADLFERGEYQPPALEESVNLCALLLKMFSDNYIEVIRLGLHYSEALEKDMLFNNYHPAFKELCESKILLDEFLALSQKQGITKGRVLVCVNPTSVSKFVGQKRSNLRKLCELGFDVKLKQDSSLSAYSILIEPQG